jgi:hypothetical protein
MKNHAHCLEAPKAKADSYAKRNALTYVRIADFDIVLAQSLKTGFQASDFNH